MTFARRAVRSEYERAYGKADAVARRIETVFESYPGLTEFKRTHWLEPREGIRARGIATMHEVKTSCGLHLTALVSGESSVGDVDCETCQVALIAAYLREDRCYACNDSGIIPGSAKNGQRATICGCQNARVIFPGADK